VLLVASPVSVPTPEQGLPLTGNSTDMSPSSDPGPAKAPIAPTHRGPGSTVFHEPSTHRPLERTLPQSSGLKNWTTRACPTTRLPYSVAALSLAAGRAWVAGWASAWALAEELERESATAMELLPL
jgi:hypothetical protein